MKLIREFRNSDKKAILFQMKKALEPRVKTIGKDYQDDPRAISGASAAEQPPPAVGYRT